MGKKSNHLVETTDLSERICPGDPSCKAKPVRSDLLAHPPGRVWNDENIRLGVERFYKEHARLPLTREFDSCSYLPGRLVILKRYRLPIVTWLTAAFPDYGLTPSSVAISNYKKMDIQDFRTVFLEEYRRIRPASSYMFNAGRTPGTPTWQYIARRCGMKTWTGLKEFTGVSSLPPTDHAANFTVVRHIRNLTD